MQHWSDRKSRHHRGEFLRCDLVQRSPQPRSELRRVRHRRRNPRSALRRPRLTTTSWVDGSDSARSPHWQHSECFALSGSSVPTQSSLRWDSPAQIARCCESLRHEMHRWTDPSRPQRIVRLAESGQPRDRQVHAPRHIAHGWCLGTRPPKCDRIYVDKTEEPRGKLAAG